MCTKDQKCEVKRVEVPMSAAGNGVNFDDTFMTIMGASGLSPIVCAASINKALSDMMGQAAKAEKDANMKEMYESSAESSAALAASLLLLHVGEIASGRILRVGTKAEKDEIVAKGGKVEDIGIFTTEEAR